MDKSAVLSRTSVEKAVQSIEVASFEEKEGTSTSAGFNGWMRKVLLTVETKGIQRVTDEERQANPTKVWNACTFWSVYFDKT